MSTSTTSLHHAAHNGDIEEVKRLLEDVFVCAVILSHVLIAEWEVVFLVREEEVPLLREDGFSVEEDFSVPGLVFQADEMLRRKSDSIIRRPDYSDVFVSDLDVEDPCGNN